MTLVGVYVALSKPLVAAIPVFLLAFLRFGIAAVAMLPWTVRARGEAKLSPREFRFLFLQSFFGNFLFSICMLSGIALATATAAGVILATLPAAVAILSWIFLRESLSRRVLLAVFLAVGGIALLQLARAEQPAPGFDPGATPGAQTASALGSLLLFGAVVCEAIYVIIGKRLTATRTPLRVSALINLWGLALSAPFGVWQLTDFDLASIGPQTWVLLVFYSLAASWIAVWLWMAGLKHVPANRAGVFTVALPIAATAVGVFLLGESFTALHAAALAAASAGVVLIATDQETGHRSPVTDH